MNVVTSGTYPPAQGSHRLLAMKSIDEYLIVEYGTKRFAKAGYGRFGDANRRILHQR